MEFAYDARTQELREQLLAFMDEHIYPNETLFHDQLGQLEDRWDWTSAPVMQQIRAEAKRQGLWNLFLPGEHGAGLTNLQYAPLAEITGRSGHLAPAAFNCAAPDTGNMEVLALFGTDDQRKQWLDPLLAGEIRSAFAMTEPDVASSDATNIEASIVRDGDHYIVNGRKWWTTGGPDPRCKLIIFMGKTDPSNPDRHRQQSMLLVPADTAGVRLIRHLAVFGY